MKRSQLSNDRALARRVVSGSTEAFEEFFREYFPRLYRFTLTRVNGNADIAEEVVQRTMCLVVRKLKSYRGEALLFTWLCQICRNEMAAVFRERRMEAQQDNPLEDNPAVQAALASLSLDVGPEKSQSDDEVARFVRVTLEFLPTRYASALEMKYIQGYTVDEIGERLNISSKAAESVLSRARDAFREGFRSLWDFEPDFLLECGAVSDERHRQVDIMNDYDNPHDGPIDKGKAPGGDSVARLIRLAGPRPLIPGDVQMRVHAAVRREWQGSYQRRRTLRWGIPFALAAAVAVVTVGLVRAPEIAVAPIATIVKVDDTGSAAASGQRSKSLPIFAGVRSPPAVSSRAWIAARRSAASMRSSPSSVRSTAARRPNVWRRAGSASTNLREKKRI